MRKIAHISDLHFGTEDETIADGLLKDLTMIAPDLVIISGDLTQRARRNQYAAARDYLSRISFPKIVVPGNHDIPLFDLFRRFFSPLNRYREFISNATDPSFIDEELAVLGINTARSLTWKNGRISAEQMDAIEKYFCIMEDKIFKIIVTHHPFIPPPGNPGIDLVGRSVKALNIIDKCNVDLLLAGHIHTGYSGDIRTYYPARKRSLISVQAGTAISNRRRSEPNAYNLITIDQEEIQIHIRQWDRKEFRETLNTLYRLKEKEWIKVE